MSKKQQKPKKVKENKSSEVPELEAELCKRLDIGHVNQPRNPIENLPLKYRKGGGPGRPAGWKGGRQRALAALDAMLAKPKNRAKLVNEFQRLFDINPGGFWLKFVMPLLPRQAKLEMDQVGDIVLKIGTDQEDL